MFDWLAHQHGLIFYCLLFFSSALESIFPPHPADILVLITAFLAGQGDFNPWLVFCASSAGTVTGIMILYSFSAACGTALLDRASRTVIRLVLPPRLVERVRRRFQRHGNVFLILHRFMPGMRAAIIFTAGLAHKKPSRVLTLAGISVVLWNLFLVGVAFRVGQTWDSASAFIRRYNYLTLAVLGILLTAVSLYYFLRHKK